MFGLQNMENTLKWTKLKETTIPLFTIGSITNYFISRLANDGQPTNDYKNMNSHSYPLFKAGHIQSIYVALQGNKYMIRCVCLPEMKKDILYKLNLTMDSSGEILSATCGCPAGNGPTGSCKHISALCYALEEFSRIKELRSPQSCTSQLQKWNQLRKRRLDSCCLDDITFIKHEYGKKKKMLESLVYDPRPPSFRSTSEGSIQALGRDLKATGKDIALVHLLTDIPSDPVRPSPSLPPPPPVVRQRLLKNLQDQPQPVHFSDIAAAGLAFIKALQYTKDQRVSVEAATRQQSLQEVV